MGKLNITPKNKTVTQTLRLRTGYVQYYTDGSVQKFRNDGSKKIRSATKLHDPTVVD